MIAKNVTISNLFKKHTFENEGRIYKLISPMNLMEGMRVLGLENLTPYQLQCLIKVMSKAEFGEAVLVTDFEKKMKDYGVACEEPQEKLPQISKVATEVLVENQILDQTTQV